MAVPAHASDALKHDAATHTAAVAELLKTAEQGIAQLNEAFDAALDEESLSGDLYVAIENLKINRADEAVRLVDLWKASLALRHRLVTELEPLPAQRREECERVVAEVKAALIEIGCCPEATQAGIWAGGRAGGPADRQFDFYVRHHNTRTVAARRAAEDAAHALKISQSEKWKAKAGVKAAQEFLAGEMKRAVGEAAI